MHRTLHEFLDSLDTADELLRVQEAVSPILEIAAASDLHARIPATPSAYASAFDPLHADLGGKALLFENVSDCDFPVAINIFGSYRRMEMALGCDSAGGFESIAARIATLSKPEPPSSFIDALRKARMFLPLLRITPRRVRRGVCQEVVKLTERSEVDLTRLPLIKCWPSDGDPRKVGIDVAPEQAGTARGEGRYITFAGMHTIHFDDAEARKPASHNIGMYRAQLVDETHLLMHWHVHHDGAAHWRSWKRAGKPMPIAICFGGESVLPYAATAPMPPGMSELLMAGFLHGHGIPLVRAKTVPLWVPANSEIVIEGWVSTECGEIGFEAPSLPSPSGRGAGGQGHRALDDDFNPPSPNPLPKGAGIVSSETGESLGPGAAFEGPFGDHTGYYSMPDRYPIVEVSAITHRRDAIFPAIIVGRPPQEDYYLGKATERIFFPLLKIILPDIEDYHLPLFGCFHNCAFVKIRKAYPLHARRVMHAIWGAGQMAWTKMIVIVDDDVNVHDEVEVLRATCRHCHFGRDIEIVNGPLDILDHAAPRLGAGQKIGFDATRAWPGEEVNGIAHDASIEIASVESITPPGGVTNVKTIHVPDFGLGRLLFLDVDKTKPKQGIEAINAVWDELGDNPGADWVIAVSDCPNLTDFSQVLFHFCANLDPGRDRVQRGHRLGFDATIKMPGDERHGFPVRPWPPLITMDGEVEAKVRSLVELRE